MKREEEKMERGELPKKKPDKSNVEQNWGRDKRDFENKDKGKLKEGEIKEEPKGTKA